MPSQLSTTWVGHLADMRDVRYESELHDIAASCGVHLLGPFQNDPNIVPSPMTATSAMTAPTMPTMTISK
jgi:hypothetical protein